MELVNTRVSGEEGGLDHGGGKGDSGAEGECGEGGMVQRSLQREKDSGQR